VLTAYPTSWLPVRSRLSRIAWPIQLFQHPLLLAGTNEAKGIWSEHHVNVLWGVIVLDDCSCLVAAFVVRLLATICPEFGPKACRSFDGTWTQ
jgi:hypothetical protein